MSEPIDLLQLKIEEAKAKLPDETRQAISAVDWKPRIIEMRAKKGYTFTQLEDLEIETELLLCGLLPTEDYPKELEKRMGIPRSEVDELVKEMNDLVFRRIHQEFTKIIEGNKKGSIVAGAKPTPPVKLDALELPPAHGEIKQEEAQILSSAGIEIVPARNASGIALAGGEKDKKVNMPQKVRPLLEQKMANSFQIPTSKTQYSMNNIKQSSGNNEKVGLPANIMADVKPVSRAETKISPSYHVSGDPYRELPE